MKISAPLLLSFNGGYVDTAGFLALQGLFTAHVTGNFVTFGAAMVEGTSGAFAKLLALPVFCVTIVLARIIAVRLGASSSRALKTLLAVKVLLLGVAAAFALAWGPFPDGDSWRAILTGMTLVCAMAIQNGAHRVYLPKAPPSTLMTGTTTQVMLDLADLLSGAASPQQRADIRGRLRRMVPNVIAFAAGCGVAALVFMGVGLRAFLLPPLVTLAIVLAIHFDPDPEIA
ncbi:MAG: YoaK family protein [Xanthobacteraceae bacterium]